MHSLWFATCSENSVCAGAAAALTAAVAHITSQQAAGRDLPAAAHSSAEDDTVDGASIRLSVDGSEMVEEEQSEHSGHASAISSASCPFVTRWHCSCVLGGQVPTASHLEHLPAEGVALREWCQLQGLRQPTCCHGLAFAVFCIWCWLPPVHQLAAAQTGSRPTLQARHACSAAVASQAAASVADEVLQAGIETSSDARSVSEAQYSDDFEGVGRRTPSRTGEVLLCLLIQANRHRQELNAPQVAAS